MGEDIFYFLMLSLSMMMKPPATPTSSKTATALTGLPSPLNGMQQPALSHIDANALLDSLDAYNDASSRRPNGGTSSHHARHPPPPPRQPTTTATATAAALPSLDPVEFLNRHYTTESMLVSQLPVLRDGLASRMSKLDDRISTALQRQSETADATRRHVQEAKASVTALESRVRLLHSKASQSEKAVLEITMDMKRLDCAKRNLQRTITTLKQLHMLLHAVEQLRLTCLLKPFPDYKTASHLVDAIRLLLQHFDAYTAKVEPMRLLDRKVTDLQQVLKKDLVKGFRVVAFGISKALEMEKTAASTTTTTTTTANAKPSSAPSTTPTTTTAAAATTTDLSVQIMTPDVLCGGVLLIDALGTDARHAFVHGFCQDYLAAYRKLFQPSSSSSSLTTASAGSAHSSRPARTSSFKIAEPAAAATVEENPACLDQVERRFAWFRRTLREMMEKFPNVFPAFWNLQYTMTRQFLQLSREHIHALLDGPTKDKDADNATVLLKAFQKTILFEKEMTAWLQRDFATVFIVKDAKQEDGAASAAAATSTTPVRGDDGEELEFDEAGNAVAANSAQGIRLKYQRQKKEKMAAGAAAAAAQEASRASDDHAPVEPILGVASSVFDNYMAPYIALEEQSMNEQLVESLEDKTVDTRGELPVFTSSTALFVYIKGSITRCTALSKGKAFLLLYQSFQDSLRKYSQVLSHKLPIQTTVSVGGIALPGVAAPFGKQDASASSISTVYKIPKGEEVTVCHVIATCEYCSETVEALQDLIRDTIDKDYESKIDMSNEQEAFHDVTAKAVRILVSGLEMRLDAAFRMMSTTNWATLEAVGEESSYVRLVHEEIHPFVTTVRELLPTSYFRSFCDKFATAFTKSYYDTIMRQKRISENGAQQLLLDVYNLKTLLLKVPVLEKPRSANSPKKITMVAAAGSTIAPALYTKMVQKQFKSIETVLKLVGTPTELLIDVFKVQWVGGSALDLQIVMTLKGVKRTDQVTMLEKFGVDPVTALKGATIGVTSATIVSERVQALQEKSVDVAAKVNSDLNQMRQKVDDFRRAFL